MFNDVPLLGWYLVILVGAALLSGSSPEHVDLLGVVGLLTLTSGMAGLYTLGYNRGRDGKARVRE